MTVSYFRIYIPRIGMGQYSFVDIFPLQMFILLLAANSSVIVSIDPFNLFLQLATLSSWLVSCVLL